MAKLTGVLVLIALMNGAGLREARGLFFPGFDQEARDAGYFRIDLRKAGNDLFIEPVIEGQVIPLALDTGASISGLDATVLGMLETRRPARDSGIPQRLYLNNMRVEMRMIPELTLGNRVLLRDCPFAAADWAHFWKWKEKEHRRFYGLWGLDLLERLKPWISYPNRCLYMRSKRDWGKPGGLGEFLLRRGYEAVPLRKFEGHLLVPVNIMGNRGMFLLDTGAYYTFVDIHFARRTGLRVENSNRRAGGARGEYWPLGLIAADQLFVGQTLVRGKNLSVQSLSGLLGGVDHWGSRLTSYAGLLGADLLFHCNAFIDIEQRVLYLNPP